MTRRHGRLVFSCFLAALPLLGAACGSGAARPAALHTGVVVPDLSGLAWIEGEAFLAVHDAKMPGEAERPRVSVVEMPQAGRALRWTPLDVAWPVASGPSHDLESIAHIPGTSTFLLVESGDGASRYRRIFVAGLEGRALHIREVADWPLPVFDVEGTAVARLGDQLYFVFAERAHGEPSTRMVAARLSLDPLRLRVVQEVEFANPMQAQADTRPVSALEIDGAGRILVASAYDPEQDRGPFRSAVWDVGRFARGAGGEGPLQLLDQPTRIATLDGLKVESLARRGSGRMAELIAGTDDEDFGGVVRRLP